MADGRLFLFGAPRLEPAEGLEPLASRKGLALLAYLAAHDAPQTRATLATLLWPEHDQAGAHANLRRTLYRARRAVGRGPLAVTPTHLGLRRCAGLWVDLWALGDRLASFERHDPASPAGGEALRAAAALHHSELLEGFDLAACTRFEEWASFERNAPTRALTAALERRAEASLHAGEAGEAVEAARRWLARAPLSEAANRMLMRALAAAGEPAAALERYEGLRRMLDQELAVAPDPSTDAIRDAIRAGLPLPSASPSAAPSAAPVAAPVAAPEVRYVRSGDVHIAYQVVGTGPIDLLVAPGFVSHLEHIWRSAPLRQALSRLASRSRLILFDRRGVGLSDRVGVPPTLAHTAKDLGTVLDAVGSHGAVLFGFSEGGPAAALFAALHPERVRGLVLYGTMARGLRAPDHPWALEEAQFDTWLARLVARWGKPVPHEAFAPSRVDDRELWTWYAELLRLGSSPGAVRGVLGALKTLDIRPLLPWIETPTLVLHRVGDRIVHIGAGRHLAARLPRSRRVELEGDDHWWWLGDADALLLAVERFLDERTGASAGTPLVTLLCALPGSASRGAMARDPAFEAVAAREGGIPLDAPVAGILDPGDAAGAGAVPAAARDDGAGPRWAQFDDPLQALRCAQELAGAPSDPPPRVGVHCGVHAGRRGGVRTGPGTEPGPCSQRALEAAAAARPGETLVTARVQAFGAATGFSFEPRRPANDDVASRGPWWALR